MNILYIYIYIYIYYIILYQLLRQYNMFSLAVFQFGMQKKVLGGLPNRNRSYFQEGHQQVRLQEIGIMPLDLRIFKKKLSDVKVCLIHMALSRLLSCPWCVGVPSSRACRSSFLSFLPSFLQNLRENKPPIPGRRFTSPLPPALECPPFAW